MTTRSSSTVTVTNPDGTRTTTRTQTVEERYTEASSGVGGFDVGAGSTPEETGPFGQVDEVPPIEKVVLETVLEGVGIVQKGAEYVRRVSKIAGLFLAKKD